MDNNSFKASYLNTRKDVLLISFSDGASPRSLIADLADFFSAELAKGLKKWVLDFSNIPFPSTSLIAFVISATFRARSRGGDLKIIHAKDSTRNNFVTFSQISYLT